MCLPALYGAERHFLPVCHTVESAVRRVGIHPRTFIGFRTGKKDSGQAEKIPDRQKRFRTGKKDSGQAKKPA